MSSLAKLKDEARRHEQREEWERAIQLYLRVLKGSEAQEGELPLYNRIGDLYVRMGRAVDAVQYYEEAADHYAQAGLFNNAIALCNKALRYTPNRPELYRKVGRYCAMQGFTTDARRWFLEYAERVFAVGELEEAFSALDEFADLGADPDVRELLGHMLHKYDRMDDALREFRRAYGLRLQAGDETASERIRKEVASLFPDLEELTPETIKATSGAQPDRPPDEAGRLPGIGERGQDAAVADDGVIPGEGAGGAAPSGTIDGLETTRIAGAQPTSQSGAGAMPGLEPTSLTADDRAGSGDDSLQPLPLLRSSSEEEEEEKERKAAETASSARAPEPLRMRNRSKEDGASPAQADPGSYVDLIDLIGTEEERSTDTRFRIEERAPTGDEDRDFAELLAQFKAKLAEHVPEDDAASHYDLGLAFREMGLVDEAINEFQRALRAGDARLKILEELGQCFIDKGQHNVAVKVLARALQLQHDDDLELIGVYYHLGRAYEELGHAAEARDAYERVMGLDIAFRDVSDRIVQL